MKYDLEDALKRYREASQKYEWRKASAIARQVKEHGYRHPSDILYSRYLADTRKK